MSIHYGKNEYNARRLWQERSELALSQPNGKLYAYDVLGTDSANADRNVAWLRAKVGEFNPQPQVLEIGSGFGKWANALSGLYQHFTGVEVINQRVEHAQALHRSNGNVCFYHKPDPTWNLGRKFGVIIIVTVLQHLVVPDAVKVLQCAERHLADNGLLFIIDDCIHDITLQEAEFKYETSANAAHMVPKPLSVLEEAVPQLDWFVEESGKFILRKRVRK